MGVWGGRLGRSVERKDYTHKKEVKLIVRFGVCLGRILNLVDGKKSTKNNNSAGGPINYYV